MKTRKFLALVLSLLMLTGICSLASSAQEPLALSAGLDSLNGQFLPGQGPETEGHAIDYRYFSPVKENDSTKYPLVVWLHGMGDGASEGRQVTAQEIALWSSAEYQSRFRETGGAFIIAPRSLEEYELYWDDCLIYPLRAALDSFIAQHRDNIDISRIYVGGYSMGGKMTLKMAVAYPEFFAAAFPICPAWVPDEAAASHLKDMPLWLTSGKLDPLVGYHRMVLPTWRNILSQTNIPELCRLSSQSVTARPNGLPIASAHFSWIAVNNDMFSNKNGDYPFMKTVDGEGNDITLTYPEGMISWLSSFSSDYDGAPATDSGNAEATNPSAHLTFFEAFKVWLNELFGMIFGMFK
ncbi:MAG: hypothetical protein IJN88_07490 [Clostridia bacterium]|nr:hypothetical protein [Clostridia bacterium]